MGCDGSTVNVSPTNPLGQDLAELGLQHVQIDEVGQDVLDVHFEEAGGFDPLPRKRLSCLRMLWNCLSFFFK